MTQRIRIKRLSSTAKLPAFKTPGAAGADLSACIPGLGRLPVLVEPGETTAIPTGLAVEIPAGMAMLIVPRSGMALDAPGYICNSPGVIDSDYRGEVKVLVTNTTDEPIHFWNGDRIAQALFINVDQPIIHEVDDLGTTFRGTSGFGSTGRN